jgi:aminopeptidase N
VAVVVVVVAGRRSATGTFILGVVLAVAVAGPAAGQSSATVNQLAWLAGCWEGTLSSGAAYEETWLAPRGGTLVGAARMTRDGRTLSWEFMRIIDDSGTLFYIAQPSGQSATSFRAVDVGDDVAIFENPMHDFPQRIVYRLTPPATLLARIEGQRNGALSSLEFPLSRVACPGGGVDVPDADVPDANVPDADVPGVSLDLARHRARTLSAVRYDLDLDVTARDQVRGAVTISVERSAEAGDLVLDFRGIALHGVSANGIALAGVQVEHDHVVIAARHLRTGANELRLTFTSAIASAGAAVISYDDPQDDARYLYTLLVPSDAQLLFPVFDQPDIKAIFAWRITAPAEWRVLTNGALLERTATGAGTARHVFAATEPISSYTAAFAAGPWSVLDDDGDMTLWVRRSRVDEVDADTLLRLNRDGLEWLERYFDMPYPFGKLDLLLAPAFPFGGMEHVGAIFYNETTFIFREPPTLTRRLGRAATIYHEVAHQWFGDLVTMEWFDDLWLKEGFSTFMAARMQEQLHPEADAWKTFYLRNKPAAYAVDVTAGTTPVWQELANLDLAKSNYGPIVYNKAPSILRQLEFLVGETEFRDGVRLFLGRHAFGNATWRDLLAAISEAAGRDLSHFGEQYILRPGIPIVETRLALQGHAVSSLVLEQRPARTLADDPGGWWPARVRVRLGYADRDDVVLDVDLTGQRTEVVAAAGLPAPDFVFANDGDYGYGIFLPDPRSADWLLARTPTLGDDLLRTLAWGALWDLVRESRLDPADFTAAALAALPGEADEQIAGLLLGRAGQGIARYMTDSPTRDRLAGAFESLLLARVDDAALTYDLRRASLDALLASARSPAATVALKEYLKGVRRFNGEPLGQPSRWAAVTRLLVLDDPDAQSFFDAEAARDSTPEAARMAFIAGAARPTAANKRSYYERYFGDDELNEEWVTASLSAFNHERHGELTLPWLRPALDAAPWLRDNRRIFFLPRWLDAFIGGHTSPEALAQVDAWLAETTALAPDIRRRVLQARDELERTVNIRGRGATRK